ncbi:MAG: hypothetical protein LBG77_05440, partial [Dysgonamonadaceae bacterium]|nr:hypothetical protein [Dysgonamonadaceae bacterium]
MKKLIIICTLFSAIFSLQAQELATVKAVPANDFLKTIGVNTAINERGEQYVKTRACAEYLGFRYIRMGVFPYLYQLAELYDDFHIRFSIMLGTVDAIPTTIDFGRRIVQQVSPDAFIAFEGCNEPNNWGISYNGEKSGGFQSEGKTYPYIGLAKYHRDFYTAVKADPVVGSYPVWSSTDAGGAQEQNVGLQFIEVPAGVARGGSMGVDPLIEDETKFADVATVHNYFSRWTSRVNNHTWMAADPLNTTVNSLKSNFGTTWRNHYEGYTDEQLVALPRVTTETGATIDNYEYSEEYQGLTYLSCYLAQFKQGFQYTAMYIMRDRTDESGNQTYGFYKGDYTPRLSAHYLHNLTSVLADYPSIENPGELAYGIQAAADSPNSDISTVHDFLLQKNNGVMYLVVWGERYQRSSKADKIEVRFGKTLGKVNVYSPAQYDASKPDAGVKPVATYENTDVINLEVLNRPFILEINPVETAISTVETT